MAKVYHPDAQGTSVSKPYLIIILTRFSLFRKNSKSSKKLILVWKLRLLATPYRRKTYTICTVREKQQSRSKKSNSGNRMQSRTCTKMMRGQGKTLRSGRNRNSLHLTKLSMMSSWRTDIRKTSTNTPPLNISNNSLSVIIMIRMSSALPSARNLILTRTTNKKN